MAVGGGRGGRFSAIIWPGFVDVMTALILVLFFVLSIFMIVQFVLRDTITGQGRELEELSVQVANLADALGLERSRADREAALVATLTAEAETRDRDRRLRGAGRQPDRPQHRLDRPAEATERESAERLDANAALEAALAQARAELDEGAEAARLAAARREALEALVASLETDVGACAAPPPPRPSLSEAEAARLTEAAAAEALRARLGTPTPS